MSALKDHYPEAAGLLSAPFRTFGGDGEHLPHEAEQEAIREMVAFRAPESPLSDMADTARGPECENGPWF